MQASSPTRPRPRFWVLLLPATILCAAAPAAAQLGCGPSVNPCVVALNQNITDPAGATVDFGTRAVVVKRGIAITVAPGNLTLKAGNVTFEPGARITANGSGDVGAKITIVSSGEVRLQANADGGSPSRLDATATFQGGEISIRAVGSVLVDGVLDAKSADVGGGGGVIAVGSMTGNLTFSALSRMTARGGAQGGGGSITLLASIGTLTVSTPLEVYGGDGGDVELESGGNMTLTGPALVDLHATSASGGYGGIFTVTSAADISLGGKVDGRASGNFIDGAGTGAELDFYSSGGSITIGSVVDLSGPAPDGEGGAATIDAALDLTVSGTIDASGRGADGCGGTVDLSAGRTLTMGTADLSGGTCGAGDFSATARGALTQRPGTAISVDSRGGAGGSISLDAATIGGPLNAHADGLEGGMCGLVLAHACTLDVPLGARLSATGGGRAIVTQGTRLDANVAMTLRGTIQGCPPRLDSLALRYADTNSPPDIAGAQLSPAPTILLSPNLIPCQGTPPPTTTSTTSTTTTTTSPTSSTAPVTTTTASTTTVTAPPLTTTTASTTTTTQPVQLCGNGVRDGAEACDGPDIGSATCPGSTSGAFVTCNGDCTLNFDACPPAPTTTSTTSTSSTTTTTTTTQATTSTIASTTTTTTSTTDTVTTTVPSTTTTSLGAPTSTTTTTTTSTSSSATSSTATTSTATTSTASTTATTGTSTTTAAPTTSLVVTTTTSAPTTTTLPPAGCVVEATLACDAGEPCDTSTGYDAVGCRLDLLDGTLVQTSPEEFGGTGPQKKLRNKITGARRLLQRGQSATSGKRSQKSLKKAAGQLNALVRLVQKGEQRGKIDDRVGGPIITLAQRTIAQVGRLQGSIVP